jgi:hypothetical protein
MADAFAKKLLEDFTGPIPFETDEIIEVIVPKFYFNIKFPYFRKDTENQELCIGLRSVTLFTLGKQKIKRHAFTWESKKKTGNVLKIKRSEDLCQK